jgi:hypothetical protein
MKNPYNSLKSDENYLFLRHILILWRILRISAKNKFCFMDFCEKLLDSIITKIQK